MGLTNFSVGKNAQNVNFILENYSDTVIALAGNPNVGKSTIFNSLTGMKQHTGNWPGKTVSNAKGIAKSENNSYVLVDIPGTYSLLAHSEEEEIARDFLCFGEPDATVVVCDATCLERNLNLVLQILEVTSKVLVCINLIDQADKKGIKTNTKTLSQSLGVPVISISARKKASKNTILSALDELTQNTSLSSPYRVSYCEEIEKAISMIMPILENETQNKLSARWVSIRLLCGDNALIEQINQYLGKNILTDDVKNAVESAKNYLLSCGFDEDKINDCLVESMVYAAETIAKNNTVSRNTGYSRTDRKVDKILTGKFAGYPFMIILLAIIFWITITAANYPSALLSNLFGKIEFYISELLTYIKTPPWLFGILVDGIYRVLSWVIAVMLPPMAIFFPFFTLLEDIGYLPRIAYNLDKPFKNCNACGKQALTMYMGFGCNAAGVVGCRIIDSPREKLLAILTNSFVPCNGRFPH